MIRDVIDRIVESIESIYTLATSSLDRGDFRLVTMRYIRNAVQAIRDSLLSIPMSILQSPDY